jgi:hypothetical protein
LKYRRRKSLKAVVKFVLLVYFLSNILLAEMEALFKVR